MQTIRKELHDRQRAKRMSNTGKPSLSIVKTSLVMGTLMFIAFTFLMVNFVSFL